MELLKDQLFHRKNVTHLAKLIKKVHPEFEDQKFIEDILRKFPQLELKERIFCIRKNIEKYLDHDYQKTLEILLNSLADEEKNVDFAFAAYSDYVAKNGCNKEHLAKSLHALGEFTKHFSAEFAIRPFINNFPQETFLMMQKWSLSKDHDQRRLASEGLRPKLPWAKSIDFDYKKGAEPLENLFYDQERYVTRSTANHLNDISKIDPDFVVDILKKWRDSKKQNSKEMSYIINHSLRTSVKRGHQKTLKFLGYDPNPQIETSNLKVKTPKIKIGERVEFSFDIRAREKQNLIVDYKIIYPTPHKRKSEKVFKIKKISLKKDEKIHISKKQAFKKMTTKKLYSGQYKLEIQINGCIVGATDFYLEV